jgi:hypothetical protein
MILHSHHKVAQDGLHGEWEPLPSKSPCFTANRPLQAGNGCGHQLQPCMPSLDVKLCCSWYNSCNEGDSGVCAMEALVVPTAGPAVRQA